MEQKNLDANLTEYQKQIIKEAIENQKDKPLTLEFPITTKNNKDKARKKLNKYDR